MLARERAETASLLVAEERRLAEERRTAFEVRERATAERLIEVVTASRDLPAKGIVEAIFKAVAEWRGDTPPNDDMTAVVVRITQ